jgi:cytochrome d ubiquinol oxidase subunit II
VTIWDAAAPLNSQLFLIVGVGVLVPIILAYTAYSYWVFRGKVDMNAGYHS